MLSEEGYIYYQGIYIKQSSGKRRFYADEKSTFLKGACHLKGL